MSGQQDNAQSGELKLFYFKAYCRKRGGWLKGSWWARSQEQAKFWLSRQGYEEIELFSSEQKQATITVDFMSLALFYRQLSISFAVGIPLKESLDLASFSEDRNLVGVCLALSELISAGKSFSQAMLSFPGVFSPEVIGLVAGAERVGRLAPVLDRLAAFQERTYRLQKKIRSAMVYPSILLVSTLVLAIVFIFYIFPANRQLLMGANLELPFITKVLSWVADALDSPWTPGLLLAIGGGVVVYWKRNGLDKEVGIVKNFVITRIPPLRMLAFKARSQRSLEILAILLGGGGTLDQALVLIKKSSKSQQEKEQLDKIRYQITHGADLAEAIDESDYFPPLVSSLLKVGYESGRIEEMAQKGIEICEEDISASLDAAVSIIEPVLLIFVGIMSGLAVISTALPMISLINSL